MKLLNSKLLILCLFFIFIIASFSDSYQKEDKHSYKPLNGFVPDKKTALKVAEAVLLPIYGKEIVENEKPLIASLDKNDVWIIKGSIPKLKKDQEYIGGLMYIEIRKSDCTVLRVSHGK